MAAGNFLGNDPEQMDRLATRMEQEAGKIDVELETRPSAPRSRLTLDAATPSAYWTRVSEADWNSNHSTALKRAVESLRQNAQVVKKEAAAQRQVSGA